MLTVLEILQKTTDFLAGKGVEQPRLNAELLVGHALGLKRMQLYLQFERPLLEPDLEKIRPLVRRRSQREPMQYVLGETEWHGMKLKVDRRALIPRPETEYLLELISQTVLPPLSRILDLGTGCGAIALGLAKDFPEANVTAVDQSLDAIALAKENALALGLGERVIFTHSNWFSTIDPAQRYQLIVANPPYLSAEETAEALPEVREFEPAAALVAEDQGLADLKAIIAAAPRYLAEDGWLTLETGIEQHAALQVCCSEAGLNQFESKKDLTGRDRFIFVRR